MSPKYFEIKRAIQMKKSYMSKKTQRKDFTEHRTNKYFGFFGTHGLWGKSRKCIYKFDESYVMLI